MYTIYGKPNCTNCEIAKNLLDSSKQVYQYVDVTQDSAALMYVKGLGAKSVPVVLKDDKYVGGLTELQNNLKQD